MIKQCWGLDDQVFVMASKAVLSGNIGLEAHVATGNQKDKDNFKPAWCGSLTGKT